jgi:hypothetical protein
MPDATVIVFARADEPRKISVTLDHVEQPDMVYAALLLEEGVGDKTPGASSVGGMEFTADDFVWVAEFDGIVPHVHHYGRRLQEYHRLAAAEWLRGRLQVGHVAEGTVAGLQQYALLQQEASKIRSILVPGNGGVHA